MPPLLSACLIVKNESASLARCLASVKDTADEIIVVDTGSDDDTVAIAERHGARLFSYAWTDDYAAARNVSLAHATGTFILYIDADEELHEGDRSKLLEVLRRGDVDAIEMCIVSATVGDKISVSRYLRVFRNYPGVYFVNPIHEQIWPALAPHEPRVFPSQLRIIHHGYAQSEEVLLAKRKRNLHGALKVLEADPDNAFYLYHAGVGHLTLSDPTAAMSWLERALRFASAQEEPVVLNALAQAHFDLKQHDQAERRLRGSVDKQPQQRFAWALLADILLYGQRHKDAIQALRAALAVDVSLLHTDVGADPAVLHMKLGMCELLTHNPAEALVALEAALDRGTLADEPRATAERYRDMARRMVDRSDS